MKRHIEEHVTLRQLTKEEGATDGMICRWVREYEDGGEEGLKRKKRAKNPYNTLLTDKTLTEIERLRLLVAKQEIEIERLKKDTGWKELVQTRSTLPATARIRNHRGPQSKISGQLSFERDEYQPQRVLQVAQAQRKTQPL